MFIFPVHPTGAPQTLDAQQSKMDFGGPFSSKSLGLCVGIGTVVSNVVSMAWWSDPWSVSVPDMKLMVMTELASTGGLGGQHRVHHRDTPTSTATAELVSSTHEHAKGVFKGRLEAECYLVQISKFLYLVRNHRRVA